jgi:hypothetical protein
MKKCDRNYCIQPATRNLWGVSEKLLSTKASFDFLGVVTQFIPLQPLEGLLPTVVQLFRTRLQHGTTPRYARLVTGNVS